MDLHKLQSRIKGSRIYTGEKNGVKRLYFRYGRSAPGIKATTYLQVINDRIQVVAKVENDRHDSYYDSGNAERIANEVYRKFHEVINDCEMERKKVPLHERLKDEIVPVHENSLIHQVQALRFCCSMKVSAMFADTGTGKSKIAIDLAISRFEAGQIKKALIFCPVSTKNNFQEEIDKWCTQSGLTWKIIGLESMSSSDKTVFDALGYVDHETMVIIDESHKIKTPFAKRSKRIKLCCSKTSYKLLLTGTPGESVKDLYMQYAMLSESIIGERNWIDFENKYLITDERGDILGYKNVDYLMGLVEPYTYQIKKEDVLQIPGKTFYQIECHLNADQTEMYEKYKDELIKKLDKYEDEYVPATLIFRYFTYLQQISCGFVKTKEGDVISLGSHKYVKLKEITDRYSQSIIFVKYLYEVDKIVQYLGTENCSVFTGENPKDRNDQKDKFTQGETQYFIATMGTGGTGINGLQHCNNIVFYSNSFKYLERKQCIGRIDRQGQTSAMHVYDLVPKCGIEYRILNNLERKGNLADEIKEKLYDKTKLKNYVEGL